jgi:hypothetical protein
MMKRFKNGLHRRESERARRERQGEEKEKSRDSE